LVAALAVEFFACIFMAVSRSADLTSKNQALAVGMVAGGAVLLGALAWAVVYFGFVRRGAPQRAVSYALILVLSPVALQLAIAGLILTGHRVAEAQRAEKAQQRVAVDEVESSLSALARSGAPPINVKPRATGDAGETERLVKTLMAQIQSDQEDCRRELKASGFMDVLKPQHLAKDKSLRASLASVARARTIVKACETRIGGRGTDFRHAIETSALSPLLKQQMLASYDRGSTEYGHGEVWALELEIVDEVGRTLKDLQHARGGWSVRGAKLMFTNTDDLTRWRTHIATLQIDAQREDAISSNNLQHARDNFERAKPPEN
jgi:hypothetical protein